MSERRDTSENLLSPAAIERALAGRESKEKADAFRDRVDPATKQAIAALHDEPNATRAVGLAAAPRLAPEAPEAAPDLAERAATRPSRLPVLVLSFLVLLLAISTLVWWSWRDSSPEGAPSSATATATATASAVALSASTHTARATATEPIPSATLTSEPSAVPSGTPMPTQSSVPTAATPTHRASATTTPPQTSSTSKLFFQDKP